MQYTLESFIHFLSSQDLVDAAMHRPSWKNATQAEVHMAIVRMQHFSMSVQHRNWTAIPESALRYDPTMDTCLADTWRSDMVYAPGGYHRFYRNSNDGLRLSSAHAVNPNTILVALWLGIPVTNTYYTNNLEGKRRIALRTACEMFLKTKE